MKKSVWMFSGQGSQYYKMGVDLFEEDAVFRREMLYLDEHLKRLLDTSLIDLLYFPKTNDRFAGFDRTLYTHPALFCVQYSIAKALMRRNLRPDILLGYSLGEIVAAAVANVLPVEAALELVIDQARLLETGVARGAMLAIVDSPAIMRANRDLFAGTWLAAQNYAANFVVAGDLSAIERIRQDLESRRVLNQMLPVSIAFHTPRIDSVEAPFKERCRGLSLREPDCPIASTSQIAVIRSVSNDFFWHAVRQTVQFQQTLEMLEQSGPWHYVDLGPSGTLASLVKYGRHAGSASSFQAIMTPFNQASRNMGMLAAASDAGR